VKFGVCCGLAEADEVLAGGFDYVELPAQQLLGNEVEFARLRPLATNLFFPSSIKLFGPEKTPFLDYARGVISAAAKVGVRVMVVGSGGSRRWSGEDAGEGEGAFGRVAAELADIAEPYGIVIAPESLNRSETNVGNNLRALATELDVLGVGYTADSYHVISEWVFDGHEEPAPLEHWRDQIPHLPAHVHVGDRSRTNPIAGDVEMAGFIHRLNELGYDGTVSLECRRRGSLAEALRDLKLLFSL
jgi:sugar phosphate isomerase/epimerase